MYADRITDSMQACIEETHRRRAIQAAYNAAHGITPQTIRRDIHDLERHVPGANAPIDPTAEAPELAAAANDPDELPALIAALTAQMKDAARKLEFEEAARLRDRLRALERQALGL
jgi:excinuclease ABC subunit B